MDDDLTTNAGQRSSDLQELKMSTTTTTTNQCSWCTVRDFNRPSPEVTSWVNLLSSKQMYTG
jgi:hypothetical protein